MLTIALTKFDSQRENSDEKYYKMTTVAIEVASDINFSQGARARCKFIYFYQIYPPSIDTLENVE